MEFAASTALGFLPQLDVNKTNLQKHQTPITDLQSGHCKEIKEKSRTLLNEGVEISIESRSFHPIPRKTPCPHICG